MESNAFKPYEPSELRPGLDITDNEQLAIEAGKFANTVFHPVSTCRMGNDDNAVVNDKLITSWFRRFKNSGCFSYASYYFWKYKCSNNYDCRKSCGYDFS